MIHFLPGFRNIALTAAFAALLTLGQETTALGQSNPCAVVSDSGVAYANPALFAQRKAEWLACIDSKPGDVNMLEQAAAYAGQLISSAAETREGWNVGNLIHKGNLVLGRIAVREGRIADALIFLERSGGTPGSPQLNSFGPNMSLAKDLLEAGETRAVLAYFEQCRAFWKMGGSQLDKWAADVRDGKIPNFGANLRY
jgi:hypothetical protein